MGECACGVVELALRKFRLQPLVEQATDSLQSFPGFVVVGILRQHRAEKGKGIVAFRSGVVTRVQRGARPVQQVLARPRQDICRVRRRQRIDGLGHSGVQGGGRGRAIVRVRRTQREPRHGDGDEHHAGQDGAPGSPLAAVHWFGGADRCWARSRNIAAVPIDCAHGLRRDDARRGLGGSRFDDRLRGQGQSSQGFLACSVEDRYRRALFEGNRQDRKGCRSLEGTRDGGALVRWRKHDDDARAVGRLHGGDRRWKVLLSSRIQQQQARPQWPDEFTGRIDRLDVSKRGFAIQGLADLLE